MNFRYFTLDTRQTLDRPDQRVGHVDAHVSSIHYWCPMLSIPEFAAKDRLFPARDQFGCGLRECGAGARLLREHAEMEERFPDRCALICGALMPRRTTLDG